MCVTLKRFTLEKNIKNSRRIKLQTDPMRRAELKLIESQIGNLSALPDFGYGADNYILEREKPSSNWEMLTGIIVSKDKF